MINYQEEIKHFKPSLDVDNIEEAIAGMNLTDMNDLMMQLVRNAAEANPVPPAQRRAAEDEDAAFDKRANES